MRKRRLNEFQIGLLQIYIDKLTSLKTIEFYPEVVMDEVEQTFLRYISNQDISQDIKEILAEENWTSELTDNVNLVLDSITSIDKEIFDLTNEQ